MKFNSWASYLEPMLRHFFDKPYFILFACLIFQARFTEVLAAYHSPFEVSGLTSAEGLEINGYSAFDYTGYSVHGAGDFNGDGVDDLVIGAPGANPNGLNGAGRAYLIFGRANLTAFSSFDLWDLDGRNGFIINGKDEFSNGGSYISGSGDFNGDGYYDIIFGAPQAAPNGLHGSGAAYVVFGGKSVGSTGVLELGTLNGTNGFVINGFEMNDYTASSVSAAGDFNCDGYDDLLIGAFGANPNGENSGAAYLVFGSTDLGFSGNLSVAGLDGSSGFIMNGINAGDFAGRSVSSVGYFNDDSCTDVIIGASSASPNGNSGAGESYIVFGGSDVGSSGVFELSSLDGNNGIIIKGAAVGDDSGVAVSSAGDFNQDGYDDVIIGATSADANGLADVGVSYLVYGGADVGDSGVIELSNLDGTNGFVIQGIYEESYCGRSVSGIGDFNRDGYDDIIVGARNSDPNGNIKAGQSYVVFGGVGVGIGGFLNASALDGSAGFIINGMSEDDRLGYSVNSAGDINADGGIDIVIGAGRADVNYKQDAGKVYIIYGASFNESLTASPTLKPSREAVPSTVPTVFPSLMPTPAPSFTLTTPPSAVPTFFASHPPSPMPSSKIVFSPSVLPSSSPSYAPFPPPSSAPSSVPSVDLTSFPTFSPSLLSTGIFKGAPHHNDEDDLVRDLFNSFVAVAALFGAGAFCGLCCLVYCCLRFVNSSWEVKVEPELINASSVESNIISRYELDALRLIEGDFKKNIKLLISCVKRGSFDKNPDLLDKVLFQVRCLDKRIINPMKIVNDFLEGINASIEKGRLSNFSEECRLKLAKILHHSMDIVLLYYLSSCSENPDPRKKELNRNRLRAWLDLSNDVPISYEVDSILAANEQLPEISRARIENYLDFNLNREVHVQVQELARRFVSYWHQRLLGIRWYALGAVASLSDYQVVHKKIHAILKSYQANNLIFGKNWQLLYGCFECLKRIYASTEDENIKRLIILGGPDHEALFPLFLKFSGVDARVDELVRKESLLWLFSLIDDLELEKAVCLGFSLRRVLEKKQALRDFIEEKFSENAILNQYWQDELADRSHSDRKQCLSREWALLFSHGQQSAESGISYGEREGSVRLFRLLPINRETSVDETLNHVISSEAPVSAL